MSNKCYQNKWRIFYFLKGDFNYIAQGEELVVEPFQKLIDRKQLIAYKL